MKIKKLLAIAVVVSALLLLPNTVKAQQIVDGANYFGPSIGFSFLGSTPQFGLNYERGVYFQNIGTVGIGGIFRYWGYSDNFFYGKVSYTNILIGAQGNYHFKIPDSKFDPYVGLVLAYDIGSWSATYNNAYVNYYGGSFSAGGFWAAIQAGARYWVSPTLALTGRLAFGSLSYGGLEVGVDFKF